MKRSNSTWLLGSAAGIMMIAVIAALIAAQWKHEVLPFAALGVILVLTVVKSRWVVMDFMGLRNGSPKLSAALVGWVAFFALTAAGKAALAAFGL
jgi:nitric oxide reductase NorF protein